MISGHICTPQIPVLSIMRASSVLISTRRARLPLGLGAKLYISGIVMNIDTIHTNAATLKWADTDAKGTVPSVDVFSKCPRKEPSLLHHVPNGTVPFVTHFKRAKGVRPQLHAGWQGDDQRPSGRWPVPGARRVSGHREGSGRWRSYPGRDMRSGIDRTPGRRGLP